MIQDVVSSNLAEPGRRWTFAHCEYIELSRQLLVHGQPVRMESKPLDVLQHLLENPTKVHTKDELIEAAWQTATTDQSLTTAVSKLRSAFGGSRDDIVLNLSGVGYRLAVPVVCNVDPEPGPPALRLNAGDPVPQRAQWIAARMLGPGEDHTVWVAEHVKTREAHVFKFAVDGVLLRALQREVALSRILQQALPGDDRFVRIIEWNFEQPPYFTESAYCGLNLFEFSETDDFRKMPVVERVAMAAQIAGAMAAAHNLGILHNDLKPSNVLLMRRDQEEMTFSGLGLAAGDWRIKIADFGVASLSDRRHLEEMQITDHGQFDPSAQAGGPVGTAMYRAPELRRRGATPSTRGDTYALGVILYQMICGDFLETPSIGWEGRVADSLLREDIAAAANTDPEQRLANAGALADRLGTLEERREARSKHEAEIAARQRAEQEATRQRLLRPWVLTAMVALLAGLCASIWFYRNAAHQRDLANSRNATLTAMLSFVTDDLLSQTDPLAPTGSESALHETLLEAINKALPQIERRFAGSPEVAARLHSEIGRALNNRVAYTEAEAQFELAAQRFREAEGPLSQNAIVAELQRQNSQLAARAQDFLPTVTTAFDKQQKLMQRIPNMTPELEAWRALTQSALLGFGPHPEQSLPILTAAVQRAKGTSGFSKELLLQMELRVCQPYMMLRDGPNMERAAREVIAIASNLYGPESPTLFQPQMFLQEALYIQGKYKETVGQANRNYAQFSRALGPANMLTLYALDNRGGAEGMLEDYPDAVRDELAVYEVARRLPAGKYLELDTLNDAAIHECRSGQYEAGLLHTREVIRQSGPIAATQPEFGNVSLFNLAECLISREESLVSRSRSPSLAEAETALKHVDLKVLAEVSHSDDFDGNLDVAMARLALLRGDVPAARKYSELATPFMRRPGADPYEKRIFGKLNSALHYAR